MQDQEVHDRDERIAPFSHDPIKTPSVSHVTTSSSKILMTLYATWTIGSAQGFCFTLPVTYMSSSSVEHWPSNTPVPRTEWDKGC